MVAFKDLGIFEDLPADSPLRQSRIWERPVESLTPTELIAFIRKMEGLGLGPEAKHTAEMALDTLRHCMTTGEVESSPLARFQVPEERKTYAELRAMLAPMSRMRQDAVMLAADAALSLDDVITLRWRRARLLKLSPHGRFILRTRPRHLFTDLVFWEYVEGRLTPAFSLRQHFDMATDYMEWKRFVRLYKNALDLNIEGDFKLLGQAARKDLEVDPT